MSKVSHICLHERRDKREKTRKKREGESDMILETRANS